MIDVRTMGFGEAIYSFVADDGENVNIASKRLRNWALDPTNGIETFIGPCEKQVAEKFLRERSVDERHVLEIVRRLQNGEKLWPVLFAQENDSEALVGANGTMEIHSDVLTVDGHHTYVAHAVLGLTWVPSQILRRSQWEPFRVSGCPEVTRQELIEMPMRKIWR